MSKVAFKVYVLLKDVDPIDKILMQQKYNLPKKNDPQSLFGAMYGISTSNGRRRWEDRVGDVGAYRFN